ncbi:MAG: hypothetical protein QNJ42_02485 [Crocosphaera sp.]|nr:hypothetical protein [Crocosphaera sp.]
MNFSLQFAVDSRKITQYLLVSKTKNDKSQFLAQYGYTQNNWQQLQQDILTSSRPAEILDLIPSGWGLRLKLRNHWQTPNKKNIQVITIWQIDHKNQQANFVTLYPDKTKEY